MLKRHILRSEPIKLGDREIVLEARQTWLAQRRATFGLQNNYGYGWAVVNIAPTAVIEPGAQRCRRISIHDRTRQLLSGLLAGAIALPFLMEAAVRLARPKRKA